MLLAVVSLLFAKPCLAARVSLAGAMVNSQYRYSGGAIDTTGATGFGTGLLVELRPGHRISLEFGALYLSRSFEDDDAGFVTVRKVNSVLVPATAFLNLGKKVTFSLGAGGFYNKVLTLDAYSGAQGQVRLSIPAGGVRGFVGAQYLMGLEKDQVGIAHKDLLILLGLTFGGGKVR
jgi:hypothetical protein